LFGPVSGDTIEDVAARVSVRRASDNAIPRTLPMNDDWRSRITIEPGKRGGRPCVRGMRISVYDVLSYLAAGMTVAEVLDDFPYLTPEDVQACLAYAAERERSMLVTTP
jgi:uncharacterized protein (DUF433 family)